ncbi:MAG: RNase adapter RapZ [Syntrophales bacterium]|jgi:UPF0042 nucleotide-binding protein|nr:RNase adapter RapZ [Syntrophales bacterium]MCK9527443.1 RNase adapter RapZ [Syntrophales bacterium]MDX9921547.1 RNase adapter RapZ [Syntrophales bacterium]
MKSIRVVIITGLSGSGKSTALRALEDIGFFCVDNLPAALLPKLLELQVGSSGEITKVALVMDLREKTFLETFLAIVSKLKKKCYPIEILFLDSSDERLLNRFSETRRAHPLFTGGSLLESIKAERREMMPIKEMANNVVDTSLYTIHELKELVQRYYLDTLKGKKLTVNLISFGYRYGLPSDADLVFDVRFLPNPYFIASLREYTGNDPEVEEWVMKWDDTRKFLDSLFDMLSFLIPLFEKEGKAYLTIATGCTGGKHRSVAVTNKIARFMKEKGYGTNLSHRDVKRS